MALAFLAAPALWAQTPAITVNAASTRQTINPAIYGASCWGGRRYASPYTVGIGTLMLGSCRQGGDGATRYNYVWDNTCDGQDQGYFLCADGQGRPGDGTAAPSTVAYTVKQMISNYRSAYSGTQPLITIPIIPWISYNGYAYKCSWPTSVYSGQDQPPTYETFGAYQCGGGKIGGNPIDNTNLTFNMVANTTTIQKGYVDAMISTYGNCASGGVCFYQLDNEPGGWQGIHWDVYTYYPTGTNPPYGGATPSITGLGESYASMIRGEDSTADILGPSDFEEYGWVDLSPTADPACVYYLKQFDSYDTTAGFRSLTHIDEHWQVGDNGTGQITPPADTGTIQADFDQVDSWFDPNNTYGWGGFSSYHSQNVSLGLSDNIEFIPRFEAYAAAFYPGTKVSVSEYEIAAYASTSFPLIGNSSMIDALVEAKALGVFGYYGLDLASLFFDGNQNLTTTSINTATVDAGGAGYSVGDTGQLGGTGGSTPCDGATYQVTSVSGGAVTGFSITNGGNVCPIGTGLPTAVYSGGGNGAFTYNTTALGDALAFTFELYTNYDGAGHGFGNTSVTTTSTYPDLMPAFGALRSADGKLTVMAVNEESSNYTTTVTLSGFTATGTADVYTYDSSNTGALVHSTVSVGSGGTVVSMTFPAYSATELVFTPSGTPPPPIASCASCMLTEVVK